MKSFILLFNFVIFMIFGNIEGTIDYGPLIQDVHNKYMTGSMILVSNKDDFTLKRDNILQKVSKEFLANGIALAIINSMQLKEEMKFSIREVHRLLIVIFINKITELSKFEKIMNKNEFKEPIRLILFTGDRNEDHCRYCHDPIGDPFGLKFSSKILVFCCESEYIEEWCFKEENETSILSRGKWINETNKFNWYSNKSVCTSRQYLNHSEIHIASIKELKLIWKENDHFGGIFGEIIMELSRIMNFSVTELIETTTPGAWNPESLTWTGIIGMASQRKIAIGVSVFAINSERIKAVDFTVPILKLQPRLYFKKPDYVRVNWTACFQPFQEEVWLTITIFLLILPLLLTIIKYTSKDILFDMFSEHYLNVWGILCQKSLPDCPDQAPLRIIYFSIYVMTVILYAAYSAAFISYLTTSSLVLPFHNVEEFVKDGTYGLIVQRDSAEYDKIHTSPDPILKKMMTLMLPKDSLPISRDKGLEQICVQRLALWMNELMDRGTEYHSPCEIISFETGPPLAGSMVLPLHSEYTHTINYYLQRFKDNGLLSRMRAKHFPKAYPHDITPYEPVTFKGVLSILILFAAGFTVSLMIFCIEIP